MKGSTKQSSSNALYQNALNASTSSEFKQEKLSTLQKNLLVRWINTLDVCENYLTLENIIEELKSGILLCNILKFHQPNLDFTGVNPKARAKKQCLNNVERALSILYQKGAAPRYVPTAEEIFEGDKYSEKIWILLRTIFDVFAMHDVALLLQKIVKWINKSLSYFPGRELISDNPEEIYQDFKTGINLACILFLYGPQDNEDYVPDFRMIYEHPQNRQEFMNNLSYIFNLAIKNNVPIYLKPAEYLDFDQHNFLLLQLYYLYCKFKNTRPSFSRRDDPPPTLIFKDDGRILEDNSQTSGGAQSNSLANNINMQTSVGAGGGNMHSDHQQYPTSEGDQKTNSMGVIDEVDSVDFSSTMKSSQKQDPGSSNRPAENKGRHQQQAAQKHKQQQQKPQQQHQRRSDVDEGNVEDEDIEDEEKEMDPDEYAEEMGQYTPVQNRRDDGYQRASTPKQQKYIETPVMKVSNSNGGAKTSSTVMRQPEQNSSAYNASKRPLPVDQLHNNSLNKVVDQSLRQYHAVVDENIGIFNSRIEDQTLGSPPITQGKTSSGSSLRQPQIMKPEPYIEERKAFFMEDLRGQILMAAPKLQKNQMTSNTKPQDLASQVHEEQLLQMFYSSAGATINQTAQFTNNFNTIEGSIATTNPRPDSLSHSTSQQDPNTYLSRLLQRGTTTTLFDETSDPHLDEIKCLQLLMRPHLALVQAGNSASTRAFITVKPAESFFTELNEGYVLKVKEQGPASKMSINENIRMQQIESVLMKNIAQKQFIVTWNPRQEPTTSSDNLGGSASNGQVAKKRLIIETLDKSDNFYQALSFIFQKYVSNKQRF